MADGFPVFFDPTGKRWRRAKLYGLIAISVIICTSSTLFYMAASRVEVPQNSYANAAAEYPIEQKSPSEIAYGLEDDVPVLGAGVLLRVVSIHERAGKKVAVDIYTGKITKALSNEEAASVGDHRYALERYGPTKGKYVVLTFDDGPDPYYTPKILDMLSKESAHSTFFPIGASVVKYPEIAKRITREGHDIANHTFTHADLDLVGSLQASQEINQTQRAIRAATDKNNALLRIPYGGFDNSSIRDDSRAILEAQQLGYTVATYTIDSHDWEFTGSREPKLPDFHDGINVLLLHDGGGNRDQTITYLEALIKKAKSEGYEFTSLSRLIDPSLNQTVRPTLEDRAAFLGATALLVWPKQLVHGLFISTVFLVFLSVVFGIFLAELQMLLIKPARRRKGYNPLVSVIIPAYSEEKVLERTVQHIARSYYRNLEIIIVDDGSKDGTWEIIMNLQRKGHVTGIWQQNTGKAAAINHGLKVAKGEIIISVDADTIFLPKTIGKFVRYFYYRDIGAVAGVVKVGNVKNWITRWQALEYVTSQSIERAAQAYLRAITVVPGACSAWRKEAIIKAGGYSGSTLAEDCDLTLAIQKAGYHVAHDMEAIAYTESPETIRMLAKQRFRWTFGNLQSFWKHRGMLFRPRYGWLGMYTIPKALFGILMQLLFAPMLLFVMIGNLLTGEFGMMLFYVLAAYIVLILTSTVALLFARERFSYLTATPAFRLVYSPLRTLLLYASVLAAIGGLEMGWNKVTRNGSVNLIE